MANKKIKGITIEIGADTTKLGDALKDTEKRTSSLQSELREVERALKFNPDNIELLTQKQELLTKIVAETTDKLELMENAQEQVNKQFKAGEISEDVYRAFKREVVETESKLKGFNDKLEDSEKAIEDVGKASKESGEGFTVMKGALADLVSNAVQSAVSAFGDLVSAIFELDEATEEYRSMQGKLSASAKNNGYSVDYAKQKYEDFYSLVGDDQMATNAVTNLMGLQVETETLSKLADGASGVWASYGDSIPIESLTEAINETVQVGKVTGTFADTLNWVKLSNDELAKSFGEGTEAQKAFNQAISEGETQEDAFSKALEATSSQQERADIVARFLNDTYGASIATYTELNGAVIDKNKSELESIDVQAQLGEAIAPVNRAFEEMKTEALGKLIPVVQFASEKFLELYNYLKEHPVLLEILKGLLIAVATALGVLAGALAIQGLITGVSKAFAFLNTTLLANPITLVIAGISALVVAILYLWNNCEEFRNAVITIYNAIKTTIVDGFNWIVNFIKGLGSTLYGVGSSIMTSLWDGAKAVWSSISGWFSEKVSWIADKLSWITGKKAEVDGSHFGGLSYVPYDGYVAMLHKGERVLTANENKAYSGGTGGGGVNVTQNIYVPTDNPRELERQATRNLVKLGLGV